MTRLFRLSLMILLFSASAALAQTQTPAQFPATAAGTQFSGWLAAFNTHDRATFLAFLQKNYPDRVAHIDDTMAFGNQTGGFDVIKVEKCEELTCTVLVQEKNSDQFAEATAEVDPAPPHVLKKLSREAKTDEARDAIIETIRLTENLRGRRSIPARPSLGVAATSDAHVHRKVFDAHHKQVVRGKLVRTEGAAAVAPGAWPASAS